MTKRAKILLLGALHLSGSVFRIPGRIGAQQSGCAAQMSKKACDVKTNHDLAVAIRDKREHCEFEPDWRPSNSRERLLQVIKSDHGRVEVKIKGKTYALQAERIVDGGCNALQVSNCPAWKPRVGETYPVMMTDWSQYLNECINRMLPADREACVGFGKIVEEKYAYGISRTSQYTVCYSLPQSSITK